MENRCEDCEWWIKDHDIAVGPVVGINQTPMYYVGDCHRFPPDSKRGFPKTTDIQFCGEFNERKTK